MKTLAALLLGLALLMAQVFHGGAFFPALAWPAYGMVVVAALLAIVAGLRSASPPSPLHLLAGVAVAAVLIVRSLDDADFTLARIDAVAILAVTAAFLVSASLPDAKSRMVFLLVLLVGVIGQAAVAAMQMSSQGEIAAVHWFSATLQEFYETKFPSRVHGTFLNPNQLAWFVGVVALFCSALAIWGRMSWPMRLVWVFFALLCVAMEVGAASRGGLASLAAGFAVLLVGSVGAAVGLSRRVSGAGTIFLGSVAALVIGGIAAAAAVSASWTAQGRMQTFELENDLRGRLFDDGVRAFQAAPVFGNGPGSFAHLAREYRHSRHQAADPVYAHNDWVQLLAEYGWIGFAVVVLGVMILWFGGVGRFAAIVRDIRENRSQAASNTAAILLGAVAATAAMAVHSFLDFNLRIPANAILAGAVLGLLANPDGGVLRKRGRVMFARVVNVALLAGVACGLGWAAWRFANADYRELIADNAIGARSWRIASTEASQGLERDPENGRLMQILAKAQFSRAVGGLSRDIYGRIEQLVIDGPTNETGVVSGEQLRQAAGTYEKLSSTSPRERSVFAEYANVLMRSGKPREAEEAALAAVKRDPRHAFAYQALGDVYLDRGDLELARRTYFVGASLPGGAVCAAKYEAVQEILAREADGNAEAVKE